MGNVITKFKGVAEISAKVIRVDGTIEDLGVIASNKPSSIFKKIMDNIKKLFK